MARRVFLLGYYGFGNLGDELLCQHYRAVLREALPDSERWILTAGEPRPDADPGEIWVNRWDLRKLFYATHPGDLWVAGGGTILQNDTSQRSLIYYLALLALAHRRGAKIVLLAQGFGPFKGRWAPIALRKCLKWASVIETRDNLSYQEMVTLGSCSVRSGVDPLWSTKFSNYPSSGNELLMILRAEDADNVRFLFEWSAKYWSKTRCVVFQPKDKAVLFQANGCPVKTIKNQEELLSAFEGVGAVVSSRLHGIVFSALLGVPAVGIRQDPKVIACCERLGFPWFPLVEAGEWQSLPEALLQKTSKEEKDNLTHAVESLRNEAMASREWAIEVLRKLSDH